MAKAACTRLNLAAWGDSYQSAPEAILAIDLMVEDLPAEASSILQTAWTALVILSRPGLPAPRWMAAMAKFHKLKAAEQNRVRDAVEMRMRALECAA